MKYFIITFGCQMNKSDSERIARVLEEIEYKPASKIDEADLIVVNMCSVRQSAVDRIYGLIPKFQKLKAKNEKLKTILTGCILKEDRRKFAKGFDRVLRFKDLLKYQAKYQNNFRVFVPISNGCNNFCTYCVVPFTRGHLVCRGHKEILKEAESAIQKGFKEIWLLGQNVNDYHSSVDSSIDFPTLLKMVNDISGNFWLRFTSPNPKNFSDKLIGALAECKKFTEYLNLPVQSGDNEILKKMNRPYSVEQYRNLVKKIRQKIPGIALSTDVIVGFPGETEQNFQNTVKLFKEIKYDMAYVAQYSPRPGTAAFKLKDAIPYKEKERRWKTLTKILKESALEKNKKYVGKTLEVLVEVEQRGYLRGKTRNYKTVKFQVSDRRLEDLIGQFVKVKIIDALPWGLKGETM